MDITKVVCQLDWQIKIGGKDFEVSRAEAKGRYASATVRGGVIMIRIPRRISKVRAESIFSEMLSRIKAQIESNPDKFMDYTPMIRNGHQINVLGEKFRIMAAYSARKAARVSISPDTVYAELPDSIPPESRQEALSEASRKAISRRIMPMLKERVGLINSRHFNVAIRQIRVRSSKHVWGSYSHKDKRINLNFWLLLMPDEIIDYVIVHELAHARVRSHSKEFWDTVSSVLPDHKARRKWLRTNGPRYLYEQTSKEAVE